MDDKDGFSDQALVSFVAMFVQCEAGVWITELLGRGLRTGVSAPWSFWAMPLIETYCPTNEFSLQRFA